MNDSRGPQLPRHYRIGYALRAILYLPLVVNSWRLLLGHEKYFSPRLARWLADIVNASSGRWHDHLGKLVIWCKKSSMTTNKNGIREWSGTLQEVKYQGFAKVPRFVPQEQVQRIREVAMRSSGHDANGNTYSDVADWLEQSTSSKFIVPFPTSDPLADSIAPYLTRLQVLAAMVLSVEPLLLDSQIWFNRPPIRSMSASEDLDQSAMRFHCDADAPGFIKAFLLLDEVRSEHGPLMFATGSHRSLRHVAWRESDEVVKGHFPVLSYGTGSAGDLVIADTRGWHKAGIPSTGLRIVAQFVFVSSYFGCPAQ